MADAGEFGELLRQRWRRGTLREIYIKGNDRVTKRYLVPGSIRRYPEPWICEHRALEKLGEGFPASFGYRARETGEGELEVVFQRAYVEGEPVSGISDDELELLADLMMRIHLRGVIVNDAAIQNFVRDSKGRLHVIDFGKALFGKPGTLLFHALVGKEFAKLHNEVLNENESRYRCFLERYSSLMQLSSYSSGWIELCRRIATLARKTRRSLRR